MVNDSPSTLLLVDARGQTHLVDMSKPRQELPGVGRFSTSMLAGSLTAGAAGEGDGKFGAGAGLGATKPAPGATVTLGGKVFRVLEPSLADTLEGLRRGPQWVSLKDGGWLVAACGLRAGDVVAEAGAGSGALTVQLAWAVAPGGRVVSLDNRPEHLKVARANVERAGLSQVATFIEADARDGFPDPVELLKERHGTKDERPAGPEATGPSRGSKDDEEREGDKVPLPERENDVLRGRSRGYQALLLDLPEPWEVLEAAADALVPGGHLACFLPTVNQVDRLVEALKALKADPGDRTGTNTAGTPPAGRGFPCLWTPPQIVENLQREWQARTHALRPHTRMLGHTGFIVTTRWLGP